jgi:hypothetical protein
VSEYPEKSALGHIEKKKRKVKLSLPKTAMSLKPGLQLMDLLLLPKQTERVQAIQAAWKFNPIDPFSGNPLFKVTQATEYLESTPQVIFAATRWNEGKNKRRPDGVSEETE